MDVSRKTAIIVGVLFIVATVASMSGQGILGSVLDDPDYLINISENKIRVIIGVLISFIDGIAIAGIAVLMFPILKKYNEGIALGYVGARIAELPIIVAYLIIPLLLTDLSQEYVKAGAGAASYFQTSGTLFFAVRHWTIQIVYIFNFIAGLMFCYLLYKSKLIPRFISILGLVGYSVMLPGTLLHIFGQIGTNQIFIIFALGILFDILLPIWLFIKGFNTSAIATKSAKTDN